MKKQDYIDGILSVHGEMRKLCSDARIKDESYLKVIQGIDELKLEQLKVLFRQINNLFNGSYRRARIVWETVPPHVWQGYLDHGRHSMNEQLVLAEKLKALKQEFLILFGFKKVKGGVKEEVNGGVKEELNGGVEGEVKEENSVV